jgi:AAA15 family ATPase/GTPase
MGFSEINIQKFRGIDNLTLSDCKQINLIAGCNNSGKSSALEAIFMLTGLSNIELGNRVNNMRDYPTRGGNDFKLLFHNLDINIPIKLTGSFSTNNEIRELSISPIVNFDTGLDNMVSNNSLNETDFTNSEYSLVKSAITGLQSSFSVKEKHKSAIKGNSKFSIVANNQFNSANDKNYKEKLFARFLSSNKSFNTTAATIDRIITNKQEDEILTILKVIEPRIQKINTGINGIVNSLIPINVMGDGIRKLLAIVTAMYDVQNGILLIDEIENGLHYSALKSLWKSIIAAAKRFNVQIFATTHNIETLQYLKDVVKDELPDFEKEVRFYTIQKVASDETKAYKYDFEQFESALENGIEIR